MGSVRMISQTYSSEQGSMESKGLAISHPAWHRTWVTQVKSCAEFVLRNPAIASEKGEDKDSRFGERAFLVKETESREF
jgi:hypothetical protein